MEDIEQYTIRELEEALAAIDAAAYPDRKAKLAEEKARKMSRAFELRAELESVTGQRALRPSEVEPRGADFLDFVGSYLCSWGLLMLLIGIAGVFGANTVMWNGQPIHGLGALLMTFVVVLIVALVFAGGMFLGYLLFKVLRGNGNVGT